MAHISAHSDPSSYRSALGGREHASTKVESRHHRRLRSEQEPAPQDALRGCPADAMAAFCRVDTVGDGCLRPHDFRRAVKELAPQLSRKEQDELWSRLCLEGHSTVQLEDLAAYLQE
eukprot:EG_transcript_27758